MVLVKGIISILEILRINFYLNSMKVIETRKEY